MKVYVIIEHNWGGSEIVKVFKNHDDATAFADKGFAYDVLEFELE